MGNDNKTLADIAAEMRRAKERCNGATALFSAWLDEWTARIEAAWKRDAAIHAMTVEANGRLREHLEIAIENDRRTAVGNAAAMCEALEKVLEILNREWDAHRETSAMWEIQEICTAALAAPQRNCDLPLVVDGPANNNADKAWLVFKRYNPDAYFDVSGLLRCIDWLLAPAAERKGGAK